MNLKERIAEKAATLIKREPLTLPQTGLVVTVRGLMSGDQLRIAAEKDEVKRAAMLVALGTEDPESGKPIWNCNDYNDVEAIKALPGTDTSAVADAVVRLSGMGASDEQTLGN